jgi:cyclic pyranopterin phosphate synthase
MAKVVAVCISKVKGVAKHEVPMIELRSHHGVEGDAHAGNWHRQVSLLGIESVSKLHHLIPEILPGAFAENILTEGICLYELPVGTNIRVGEALLEITQIGKECHLNCAIRKQTGDCVMPREGVFAIVKQSGKVCPQDELHILQKNSEEPMKRESNHFDGKGNAIMVDVSQKKYTLRVAIAEGIIRVNQNVMDAILHQSVSKGDVLGVAQVAGIMAAKNTSGIIPLCHPLSLTNCQVKFETFSSSGTVKALCIVRNNGPTGVEMEALTGVSVALLTVYDMCKSIDRGMEISGIRLLEKDGGKSGHYIAEKSTIP